MVKGIQKSKIPVVLQEVLNAMKKSDPQACHFFPKLPVSSWKEESLYH